MQTDTEQHCFVAGTWLLYPNFTTVLFTKCAKPPQRYCIWNVYIEYILYTVDASLLITWSIDSCERGCQACVDVPALNMLASLLSSVQFLYHFRLALVLFCLHFICMLYANQCEKQDFRFPPTGFSLHGLMIGRILYEANVTLVEKCVYFTVCTDCPSICLKKEQTVKLLGEKQYMSWCISVWIMLPVIEVHGVWSYFTLF